RGPLMHDTETHELISKTAGLAYPIRDGVPILLVERARTL
ncbi:MAG: Trm112 family protein, partial [Pseudomonadota bacterium]